MQWIFIPGISCFQITASNSETSRFEKHMFTSVQSTPSMIQIFFKLSRYNCWLCFQKQTLKLEYWLLIFDMDCCLQSIWNVDNKSGESVVRTSSSPVVGGIPICKRSELIFVWLSLNIVDIIQSRHVSVSIILDYIFTSSSQADIEHKHINKILFLESLTRSWWTGCDSSPTFIPMKCSLN